MADTRPLTRTSPHRSTPSPWRPALDPRPDQDRQSTARPSARDDDRRPQILGYLHLRPGTPTYSRAVLEGTIERFAERHSFRLVKVFVENIDGPELPALRELIEQILRGEARTVVIVGNTPAAFTALRPFAGVQVLTLGDTPRRRDH